MRDSKYLALNEEPTDFMYSHAADDYDSTQVFFVRTSGDLHRLLPALGQVVRRLDPLVPVLEAKTLSDHVATTLAFQRSSFTPTMSNQSCSGNSATAEAAAMAGKR